MLPPWKVHGDSMVRSWWCAGFCGVSLGLWCFCDVPMVLPWCFDDGVCFPGASIVPSCDYGAFMVFPWCIHAACVVFPLTPMVRAWSFHVYALPWCFHGASMVLPWRFNGVMVRSWCSHGAPWCLYGACTVLVRCFMVFSWCSDYTPMALPWERGGAIGNGRTPIVVSVL